MGHFVQKVVVVQSVVKHKHQKDPLLRTNMSKSGKPEMQIISNGNRVRISLEQNQKPQIIKQRSKRGQRVKVVLQGNTLILCQTYNGCWRKGRFPLPGTFN